MTGSIVIVVNLDLDAMVVHRWLLAAVRIAPADGVRASKTWTWALSALFWMLLDLTLLTPGLTVDLEAWTNTLRERSTIPTFPDLTLNLPPCLTPGAAPRQNAVNRSPRKIFAALRAALSVNR